MPRRPSRATAWWRTLHPCGRLALYTGASTMKTTLLASLALSLSVTTASAGVVMEFEQRGPGQPAMTGTTWIAGDRMRTEMGGNVVIFRADKQVLWIIQPAEGRYMEMTA